jgi:uncharacterized protein GlcG (DUF336 family)
VKNSLKLACLATVVSAAFCGVAQAQPGDPGACPVSWADLQQKMVAANSVTGGNQYPMWGVVVNRNGTVCAVAYSGGSVTSQWLLSRQIAAAKAFTANGLSLDGPGRQISTANLDPTQKIGATTGNPNDLAGLLLGVHFGNIEDAGDLYKGPISNWGKANDPLINRRVGGTITFGGGLALVKTVGGVKTVIGGLGVSGDTACRDDKYARSVRAALGMNDGSDSDKYWGAGPQPGC